MIIRDFKQYTVAEKHLQVLLGFVEEDIHDHTKQGTAFPLLKVGSSQCYNLQLKLLAYSVA